MIGILTALSWASRIKIGYDYLHAKNFDDACMITANCIVNECLLYLAKQNIRNQYRYHCYW